MHILHGTWIPQAEASFIQNGTFYLWVETTTQKRFRKPSQRHPQQLAAEELVALLSHYDCLRRSGQPQTSSIALERHRQWQA